MHLFHYGVFVGRFQPLHFGHEFIINEALTKVEKLVIVIGSSFMPRTPVNPFTFEERKAMLEERFRYEVSSGRILIVGIYDHEDDRVWADELRQLVKNTILASIVTTRLPLRGIRDQKVALTGFGKDASSYYLSMFPEWGSIQIETQHGTLNASDIRHDYLRRLPRYPSHAVSDPTLAFLQAFALTQSFKDIVGMREAYAEGKATYGSGPFLTADALVTWRGKVLLVTRGKAIGKGLLALPGGFVNPDERIFDAALRELAEETTIDDCSIGDFAVGHMIADNPKRSLRGRVVSTVFHFEIPDEVEVKQPAGSDDAAHADWYDFDALSTEQFFEDHHHIITELLS